MKPDWKDAPEWANWLVLDYDGTWYWQAGQKSLAGNYMVKSCEARPS